MWVACALRSPPAPLAPPFWRAGADSERTPQQTRAYSCPANAPIQGRRRISSPPSRGPPPPSRRRDRNTPRECANSSTLRAAGTTWHISAAGAHADRFSTAARPSAPELPRRGAQPADRTSLVAPPPQCRSRCALSPSRLQLRHRPLTDDAAVCIVPRSSRNGTIAVAPLVDRAGAFIELIRVPLRRDRDGSIAGAAAGRLTRRKSRFASDARQPLLQGRFYAKREAGRCEEHGADRLQQALKPRDAARVAAFRKPA
jgi:hypothetical protein